MPPRVLLIESDTAVAKAIMDTLTLCSDDPFQVNWVKTCAEGLEGLDGIEAILVDLLLPDSHGIDTFDRLFLAAPTIPILVLIDPRDEATAKVAVQSGAQDYLFKSHLETYLPKTLRSMIERSSYAEALFE